MSVTEKGSLEIGQASSRLFFKSIHGIDKNINLIRKSINF